jgi:TolB-like protein
MKLYINIIIICLIIIACTSYVPNVKYYKENFRLTDSLSTVAVLDFEYNGRLLTKKIAMDAADNLTADLFVKKGIRIVDRSIVKQCLQKYEKLIQGRYSQEEIKNIGKELNAKYVILGSIQSFGSMEEYHESSKNKVNITIRILNASTSEVMGIVKHDSRSRGNMDELVKKMTGEIAFYMF